MKALRPAGIQGVGMLSALGSDPAAVLRALLQPDATALQSRDDLIPDHSVFVGAISADLPAAPTALARYASRNLQLALATLQPLHDLIEQTQSRFPRGRLGIVLGTSTSGITEGEAAIAQFRRDGSVPAGYHYAQQEMGALALALRDHLGWQGPAYCISTACSGGAKAIAAAQRLLQSGQCDAVLCGGVDSLCRLTLNGFHSLENLAGGICQPFAASRDGINIGEAAALLLLTADEAEVSVLGAGESSDAYHISAPHPEGRGAEVAMRRALAGSGVGADDIHYLNLHGTATRHNDAMEAMAVNRVFGARLPVSGSKSLTGHCLGAAGAIEAALAWLLLSPHNTGRQLPPHPVRNIDPELPPLHFCSGAELLPLQRARIMSNSFAFGGSNIALVLGRA